MARYGDADTEWLKRVGISAEYREYKLKAPDFELPELTTNTLSHIAEPSIGIYFRFSRVSVGRKARWSEGIQSFRRSPMDIRR